MKFKLDENLGARTQRIFQAAGHDIQTVRQESLQGVADWRLYEICREERRCLVTLDLDFADVIRFPPEKTGGIAVIRLPRNPSLRILEELARQLLRTVAGVTLEGKLWIVEVGRVRIHQAAENEGHL